MSAWAYLKEIFAPEDWSGNFREADPEWEAYKANVHKKVARDILAAAKPKLASVKTAPTLEAFDAWRDHPVTQFVFAAHRQIADDNKEDWIGRSWDSGVADQKALDVMRVRADSYMAIIESDYEAYCKTLGLEPRTED